MRILQRMAGAIAAVVLVGAGVPSGSDAPSNGGFSPLISASLPSGGGAAALDVFSGNVQEAGRVAHPPLAAAIVAGTASAAGRLDIMAHLHSEDQGSLPPAFPGGLSLLAATGVISFVLKRRG